MGSDRLEQALGSLRDAWHDPQTRARSARYMATAIALTVLPPIEADVVGEVVGAFAQGFALPAHGTPVVACVIPIPDPSVSSGFLAYQLAPVRGTDGVWDTMASTPNVAPHRFDHRYLAQLYAEDTWHAQVIEMGNGRTANDQVAWGQWRALVSRDGPQALGKPLGSDYFLGTAPAPGQGVILWRPVLTPHGVDVDVFHNEGPFSQTAPPFVFRDVAHAKRILAQDRRLHAKVIPIKHLPQALAVQLVPAPSLEGTAPVVGGAVYVRQVPTGPRLRPSAPMPIRDMRRVSGSPIEDLHADWYVSPRPRGAFAWHPVDAHNFVCMMIPDHGRWTMADWPDVSTALQALGKVGIWAQRSPYGDPTLSLERTVPSRGRSL